MDLFIGILFVCFNNECYFMQGRKQFMVEEECNREVIEQKTALTDLGGIVEGTCINITLGTLT